MVRTSHSTLGIAITSIFLLTFGASVAGADSTTTTPERARTALGDFAKSWMSKMKESEAQNRNQPSVRPGASHSVVTYRGFGDDYRVELRPTGHPSAPFIGVIRYTERIYTCAEPGSENCSVASTVPVTEIFRYQGDRWVY